MDYESKSLSKPYKNEGSNLNFFEKFSILLGYTIGRVEITYFEDNIRKVIESIGFLLQSNIVFCAGNRILKLKESGKDLNILFFPTDPRTTNKYGINNLSDFVSVYNSQSLPEIKDMTNFDPYDPAYFEKSWCILTLKNILGEFIFVLNTQDPEYFEVNLPQKDIKKAIFVVISKSPENKTEYTSVNLDSSKIIYSKGNDKSANPTGRMRLLVLISQSITISGSEGFLFSYNESKFSCIGIYSNPIESKRNISYLEKYFKDELEEAQSNNLLGRYTDSEYSVLEIDLLNKERDIQNIERITKDIKQSHFREYGIKTFPYSIYSDFKQYFNSKSKVNILLNYGDVILEKLANKSKIQLRNIDQELLMKRILNDCCLGLNNCKPIEKLEIKNENIKEMNFKISIETFYMSKMIGSVCFYDVEISKKYGYYISDLFYHNQNIKELVMENNKLTLDVFNIIFNSLLLTRLEVLNINNNYFYLESDEIEEVLRFFNLSEISTLKRVYLRNLKMTHQSLSFLFNNWKNTSRKYKEINLGYLKENIEEYYIKNLYKDKYESQMNSERENLRVFNFSDNYTNSVLINDMTEYFIQHPCIQELYLSNCLIGDESVEVLVNSLVDLPLLTILDLSHNNITSSSIGEITSLLNSKGSIEELFDGKKKANKKGNFNDNNLLNNINLIKNERQVNQFIITFTLKLNYNPLQNKGLEEFFSNLNSSSIPFNIELDGTEFEEGGLISIQNALMRNCQIISLSIARNGLSDYSFKDIFEDFGNSIKKNKHLRRVVMNKNFISKKMLVSIFEHITVYEKQTITIMSNFSNQNQNKVYRKNFSLICDPLVSIEEAHALYEKYLNEEKDVGNVSLNLDDLYDKYNEYDLTKQSKERQNKDTFNIASKLKLKGSIAAESINIKDNNKVNEIEVNYDDLLYYIEYCK